MCSSTNLSKFSFWKWIPWLYAETSLLQLTKRKGWVTRLMIHWLIRTVSQLGSEWRLSAGWGSQVRPGPLQMPTWEKGAGLQWVKRLNIHFSNKWPISMWKDAQYNELLGQFKSKSQWDTTSHSLEWLVIIKKSDKSKFWQGCGETVMLIYCWGECKMVSHLGNSLAVPQIVKYRVQIWSSKPMPRYIPNRTENRHPH